MAVAFAVEAVALQVDDLPGDSTIHPPVAQRDREFAGALDQLRCYGERELCNRTISRSARTGRIRFGRICWFAPREIERTSVTREPQIWRIALFESDGEYFFYPMPVPDAAGAAREVIRWHERWMASRAILPVEDLALL